MHRMYVTKGVGQTVKPLNPTDIPHSREAALVCMADKMSSSYETVLERKAKRKK